MASSTEAALIGAGVGLTTIAIGPQLVSGASSAWDHGGSALDSAWGWISDQAGDIGGFFGGQITAANQGLFGKPDPPAAPGPQAQPTPATPVSTGQPETVDLNLRRLAPDSDWPSWLTWVLVALGLAIAVFVVWKAIG